MRNIYRSLIGLAAALGACTIALLAVDGSAVDAAPLWQNTAKYCVLRPAGPQRPKEVTPVAYRCYNTKHEATANIQSQSSVTNWILFEHANRDYGARHLYLVDWDCTVGSIGSLSDFNNITSSLEQGNCGQITLYDGSNATGDWESYTGSTDYVGNYMNDRASSFSLP